MTINCKGKLIDLSTPKIMGILNITPDSFYDGGSYNNKNGILHQVEKMLNEGATFIDIGAYSSRPGADFVSENEELKRIITVVKSITNHFDNVILSIDTFRSEVAKQCVDYGAALINDISAGSIDDNMLSTIAQLQVPYIMMHMRGNPQNMMENTSYENLVKDIIYYFSEKLEKANKLHINDVIIDPGFGFSKTLEQNYELMNKLELLNILEKPMLVGISRKSMIYKLLKTNPENALNGTTTLNSIALLKGAKILRVHDVKEAKECVTIINQL